MRETKGKGHGEIEREEEIERGRETERRRSRRICPENHINLTEKINENHCCYRT